MKSDMKRRAEFVHLIDNLGLTTAAEVGVDLGLFAETLLRGSTLLGKLYLVDPYRPYAEMRHDRAWAEAQAVERLKPYTDAGRAEFVKAASPGAADLVPDGLDFVYIDGAHDYPSVAADLNRWCRKLSPQGVLAGHDYDAVQVRHAVDDFAWRWRRTVYVVYEMPRTVQSDGTHPSWYMFASDPPNWIEEQ